MANSSILGGTLPPQQHSGTGIDRLGPSDSSDSGSDVQGELPMATSPDNPGEWGAVPAHQRSDSDAMGTGERGAAAGSETVDGADILPDRIVDEDGAEVSDVAPGTVVGRALDDDANDQDDETPPAEGIASPEGAGNRGGTLDRS